MPWIPKYKSDGLFGPAIAPCPMSSLANLCANYGNYYESYDHAGGNYETWSGDDLVTWAAVGVNFNSKLYTLLRNAEGDGPHTGVVLAELEFVKTYGAQYYKQTLVVIGNYEAYNRESRMAEIGGVMYSLVYLPCYIGVTGFYRREYPTPYSDPIVTPIENVPLINMPINIKLSGDIRLEPLVYFVTKGYFCVSPYEHDNKKYLGFAFYTENERQAFDQEKAKNAVGTISGIGDATMMQLFGIDIPEEQEDPNEEDDEGEDDGPGGSGGTGDHILPNYPINIPPLPDIGIASISWLTVYEMTVNQLSSFGTAMLDVHGWDALKQWFNNPLEAIVNIMLIPAAAPTAGARTPVVGQGSAAYSWPEAYPIIHEEFCEVPCGQIEIPPYWDSAFDFDSYTKFTLFLPFIGYKPIKSDDIMGGRIGVTYHVNVCTGDCIAFVYRTAPPEDPGYYGPVPGQVIAQFNGNCGVRVPIGRASSDAAIDASMRLMSGALGVGLTAIAGGAGLADPAEIGASQLGAQISTATMTAVNSNKQTIERAGSLGGSIGYMGILKPYIIREIPRQVLTQPDKTRYHKLEGYPANIGATLNDVRGTGYQAVEAIQLDGLEAYDSEISEIETYLRGGVIV